MNIGTPDGTTRICGKAQGYQGLPIRDETVRDGATGQTCNAMTTRWEPNEDERMRLLAGEPIYVRILGDIPAPIMVGVGDPNVYGW